ncbi:1-aminocyclopropane-1-carboxylate deaminase/D-cysteine desulfhydrase [Thalassotalea hakodatensis]|uniref:1-aminocyclopropane-1-carboxylate deaminase/D-cysteine desulfhydrase n=1 Tax=Thalassotalea hakodatensis TaxID=3030492 RepID=UPI0025742FA6|nr:pyridoxal-phosphate dependent enzyme [Thalassotalea hakodatensis]
MKSSANLPSPVQAIEHPLFTKHKLTVYVKRDDLIHPVVSGNKWRKLYYNLQHAKSLGYRGTLSFGGGYSNHLHALAYACQQQQIHAIGMVRGEQHYETNTTLTQAKQWGMTLDFIDRKTYKLRHDETYLADLKARYPDHFIIPEGGSNSLALKGVSELCDELNSQVEFDTIITPVGSAGTISGIIAGDKQQHNILGIAVLKQAEYLHEHIQSLLQSHHCNAQNWQLFTNFHGGGYAKFCAEDLSKMCEFSQLTQLPLEPIYSGKMILALLTLIEQGFFPAGHRIVILHTGGLQGLHGLIEQKKIKADEWLLPPAT